ncbi:MAG TPA: DUF937 domain-containing protein [Gammaproteobacteria bacterium]
MNLLDTALGNQGGLQQAARQLGLDGSDVETLMRKVVPALTSGIKRNVAEPGGLDQLQRALAGGQHQRYLDDSSALQSDEAVQDGNAILGHLFGSKEVSRNVASRVSGDTGIDAATIKRFLPVAAAALMGALSKQTAGGANLRGAGAGSTTGSASSLAGLLDVDGDGFGVDDLIALGKKLF